MTQIKKIFGLFFVSLIFIFLSYGVFLSRYSPNVFSNDLVFNNPAGFYDYSGAINVRSNLTTGSGTTHQIAEAAFESKLNFVILTDLNATSEDRENEGYINNVLMLVGSEYKYLDSRLLNINGDIAGYFSNAGRSQIYLTDLLNDESRAEDKGLFVLAHPLKPGYKWSGDFPIGLDGIEVFNLKGIWQWAWLKDRSSFAWTVLTYPFNAKLAFARLFAESSDDEIFLWDQLNQKRRVLGFAGSAAESRVKFLGRILEVPSYQTLFDIMKTHLLLKSELTGNFEVDKAKIYSALKAGQFYMSLDLLANPKGFSTYLKTAYGQQHLMGSTLSFKKNLNLVIELPSKPLVPFQVLIYKDGDRILTSTSVKTTFPVLEPGSYRVVVKLRVLLPIPDGKKWIPWIFTNPILIEP